METRKAFDGCDHEGFAGGCVRFGHTPDTCKRKPKTHFVHGVEIPDLRIFPKNGQEYWFPSASESSLAMEVAFYRSLSPAFMHRVEHNLCYEHSDEGREAAILHSKAWLGIKT